MRHARIDHNRSYADGLIHTNSIEGFWAILKRAWFGQHHHYTRKHAPAYLTEACYKYNKRKVNNLFGAFIREAVCYNE